MAPPAKSKSRKRSTAQSSPAPQPKSKGGVRKRITQSERAGLILPVARVERALKTHEPKYANRIAKTAKIYLTAVLEYLITELLRQASDITAAKKRKTVTPHELVIAIRNDPGLDRLFKRCIIAEGGVRPMTAAELSAMTPKKKQPAKKSTKKATPTPKPKPKQTQKKATTPPKRQRVLHTPEEWSPPTTPPKRQRVLHTPPMMSPPTTAAAKKSSKKLRVVRTPEAWSPPTTAAKKSSKKTETTAMKRAQKAMAPTPGRAPKKQPSEMTLEDLIAEVDSLGTVDTWSEEYNDDSFSTLDELSESESELESVYSMDEQPPMRRP